MPAAADQITVYVRPGDPTCSALLAYLKDRGVEHTVSDVTADPSASAVLFGRLGRVTVPATQIGGKMLVGFDPLQLAKFLPRAEDDLPAVSFGAAVRTVTPDIAAAAGLPAPYGVELGPVKADSPASSAGLRTGDIVTEIGGYTLTGGRDQFVQAVSVRRPGDNMVLTVWRERGAVPVTVSFPMRDGGE